jgi:hypothetical protein
MEQDMKKTPQILLSLSVVGVLLLAFATPAQAECNLLSQVIQHGIGGFLQNCAEPATGTIYSIADPTGTRSVFRPGHPMEGMPMVTLCNADFTNGGMSDSPSQPCQAAAGTNSDGFIVVNFDWGLSSPAQGCPSPAGGPTGLDPIGIDITDANGNQVTLSTGYSVIFSGYLVENAHPNNGMDLPSPISCVNPGNKGALSLVSVTEVSGFERHTMLHVDPPARSEGIFSDCEPDALGATAFDLSCGGRGVGTDRGRIYSRIGPCAELNHGLFRLTPDWSLEGPVDPGTGDFTSISDPSQLDGSCIDFGGGNFGCLTPPSALGNPCVTNADCLVGVDDCQFYGASSILGPTAAGVCATDSCLPVNLGTCTTFSTGTHRCGSPTGAVCGRCSLNANRLCSSNAQCTSPPPNAGTCIQNPTACMPLRCVSNAASCTSDFDCPGTCTDGSVGNPCFSDPECDVLPEGLVLNSVLAIGGPNAAGDRAIARRAEMGKNTLVVEFSVGLEQDAISYDILAGNRVLNASQIMAENLGTYIVTINNVHGRLKGADSIVVRTNLGGGGSVLSQPLAITKVKTDGGGAPGGGGPMGGGEPKTSKDPSSKKTR